MIDDRLEAKWDSKPGREEVLCQIPGGRKSMVKSREGGDTLQNPGTEEHSIHISREGDAHPTNPGGRRTPQFFRKAGVPVPVPVPMRLPPGILELCAQGVWAMITDLRPYGTLDRGILSRFIQRYTKKRP